LAVGVVWKSLLGFGKFSCDGDILVVNSKSSKNATAVYAGVIIDVLGEIKA